MKAGHVLLCASMLLAGPIFPRASSQRVGTSPHTRVIDPMFGIPFDYAKEHYEQMPASVRKTCSGFEDGTYWTFAHAEQNGKGYYVVLGVWPEQDGDSLGNVIEIAGSKCTVDDSTWMLSGVAPSSGYSKGEAVLGLPGLNAKKICDQGALGSCHYELRSAAQEQLLRALVDDGIKRGVLAWGGDASFRRVACAPAILKGNTATPIVRDALERYCGSPR